MKEWDDLHRLLKDNKFKTTSEKIEIKWEYLDGLVQKPIKL